ncbi:unnamed protein product [Lymnaea stagnalis]|uniref:Uncharacterized protein n=1 Tax=Lymnaea stagnalis TaxID=6523 RepID=A0AAV2H7D2_LYMST
MMGKLFSKRNKSAGSTRPAFAEAGSAISSAGHYGDANTKVIDSSSSNVKLQHSDAVVSLALFQPGLCLSGSKDMCVILYDYKDKRQADKWTGHSNAVTKVLYGKVLDKIFSSSRDKTIKVWERGNSTFKSEFVGHTLVVTAIDLNADNSLLCSGSRDNSVKLWDVRTGTCLKTNSIPQNLVTDLKFVPSSSMIVQTGEDKEIRVFDLRTLQPVFSFPKKQYIQMCCDVSLDGNYIISSSNGFSGNGCEATLWDLRTRKLQKEFYGHHEAVEACTFLPDGNRLLVATAGRDCSVKIWDAQTAACMAECFLSGSGPLSSIVTYRDGSVLAGSFNQGVHLLSHQDNMLVKTCNF